MASILLDSSAIFALINLEDSHHENALIINDSLIHRHVTLILPNFLLAESHTILNKRLGPNVARDFLNAALQDFEIERVTIEDEWAAHAILQQVTKKKDISYFDAILVAVAERLGIDEVFTFDHHFRLLGLKMVGVK
ncbi:MAG: PIN domain-containing protein [Elusimicrobia bacterium]|nr:PIN domain-containing protein [Elusimicrobiota bacterium]